MAGAVMDGLCTHKEIGLDIAATPHTWPEPGAAKVSRAVHDRARRERGDSYATHLDGPGPVKWHKFTAKTINALRHSREERVLIPKTERPDIKLEFRYGYFTESGEWIETKPRIFVLNCLKSSSKKSISARTTKKMEEVKHKKEVTDSDVW